MGQFFYKAVEQGGGNVTGTIEAVDHRSAVATLADEGRFVVELAEQTLEPSVSGDKKSELDLAKFLKFGSRRITSKDILAITSQLSTALQAGLPLLNGLEIIRDQQHKPATRNMLSELVKSVSSGQSLSEAMAGHENTFSPLYLSMVRVGETGGMLDETTSQLATMLSREETIKSNMKNASAYPIFVLCVGLVSAVIVVTWVLPRILAMIGDAIAVLPLPTRVLMALGALTKSLLTTVYGWFIIAVIVAGLYLLRKWARSEGRIKCDAFKLRIPVLGSVLRTIAVGRFARTLGALTKGGVTILEALSVVRDTLGNELLGREIDGVAEKVKTGESLAGPLGESGYFPPLLVQIVSIGEQTGKLDELLLNAADTFDSEADSAINRFMAIFPAVLILLLALVVGFIIAATLLPIVTMQFGAGVL
ncbi:MAG TPA: type II secretion system F family protein [Sedimentisphaerales bacterium]|nr:type II secretion system F family protein [Sedimentisphaerales bacterium]